MFVASIFGYGEYIEINAFITGAFSIGIISGAYSTEVFRGVNINAKMKPINIAVTETAIVIRVA